MLEHVSGLLPFALGFALVAGAFAIGEMAQAEQRRKVAADRAALRRKIQLLKGLER